MTGMLPDGRWRVALPPTRAVDGESCSSVESLGRDAGAMSEALDADYEFGPDATTRALTTAWGRVDEARSVVLVEGVSDQVAVETAAVRLGSDLAAAGAIIMPIGGAQAIGRTVAELAARAPHVRTVGLCDAAETEYFRRALGADRTVVCLDDLEDELIRAAGAELLEQVVDDLGELRALRTLQAQGPWRDAPHAAQAHRFIRSRARRGQRYAIAILQAIDADRIPSPLRRTVELAVG